MRHDLTSILTESFGCHVGDRLERAEMRKGNQGGGCCSTWRWRQLDGVMAEKMVRSGQILQMFEGGTQGDWPVDWPQNVRGEELRIIPKFLALAPGNVELLGRCQKRLREKIRVPF